MIYNNKLQLGRLNLDEKESQGVRKKNGDPTEPAETDQWPVAGSAHLPGKLVEPIPEEPLPK